MSVERHSFRLPLLIAIVAWWPFALGFAAVIDWSESLQPNIALTLSLLPLSIIYCWLVVSLVRRVLSRYIRRRSHDTVANVTLSTRPLTFRIIFGVWFSFMWRLFLYGILLSGGFLLLVVTYAPHYHDQDSRSLIFFNTGMSYFLVSFLSFKRAIEVNWSHLMISPDTTARHV